MAKQIITVRDAVKLQIEAQVELDIKYLKPDEEPDPCTPNSSSPAAGTLGPLSPSEMMDVACAFVARDDLNAETKQFSEGFLRDLLKATNGMHFDQVRSLWFDAIERGNAIVERFASERS